MKPEHWQQIEQLYRAALERDQSDRAAFLDAACRGDEALRRGVESLLKYEGDLKNLIEVPALEMSSNMLAQEPSSHWVGRQIGSYKILSLLGAGGMGEVYRAHDTKLGREVALKVLPKTFAQDPERLVRFQREAQVLASLNHPNIAAIHGLEESEAVRYLVLELIPGETLAGRLTSGPLEVEEAFRISIQIAEALETAHQKGVIHRDIKPANVKVTPEGKVKVLDFGLAKALAGEGAGSDLLALPTASLGETGEGVIMGTAAYMSPEQARGKPLDKRTDIWSFGCVLYEMLAGRAAFAGNTVSDIIAAILGREPDWRALPDATPVEICRLLRRCLEKDSKRRLHDIADARIELEEAFAEPSSSVIPAGAVRSPTSPRTLLWLGVTFALTIAVVALAALALRREPADLRQLRLSIVPPAGTTFTARDLTAAPQFALSPDGSRLAFVASARGGGPRLWVQELDSAAAQPLQGTEDATGPFWAPDSRSLAFFARGKLKKVSLGGAPPQDLADVAVDVASGSWNAEGSSFSPVRAGTVCSAFRQRVGPSGHRLLSYWYSPEHRYWRRLEMS